MTRSESLLAAMLVQPSLKTNDWLTEPTKEKALKKLAKFTTKIGYPDKWKSHERLNFEDGDDILAMRRKVAQFEAYTSYLSPPLSSPIVDGIGPDGIL